MSEVMLGKQAGVLTYRVGTFRDAGLEAQWFKLPSGQPFIKVRDPNAELDHQRKWWVVDGSMFDLMKERGVKTGFYNATMLGDIFSIPAE